MDHKLACFFNRNKLSIPLVHVQATTVAVGNNTIIKCAIK